MNFKNRQQAGQQLAIALQKYKSQDTVVYALPRGGVVTGAEVAKHLGARLDLIIPRKIGHPYNSEYAIAAVAENGEVVKNEDELRHIDQQWLAREVEEQLQEIKRRRRLYLGNRAAIDPKGKTAILVDDGLATGLTMKAAVGQLRRQKAKTIIVAVPVAPADTVKDIGNLADELVTLYIPTGFGAIGAYYRDFDQISDEEVVELIKNSDR